MGPILNGYGVMGRGIYKNVLLCAFIGCGRLVELNVRRGGATGRVEIRRNKEVMAVLSAQGERLSQAYYV